MKIYDGDSMRNMTDEEIATNKLIKKGFADSIAAQAKAEADAVTAKQAVLTKLGITEAEARMLLS